MISINIRDYRGCEFADIECAPLALVAGRNAVGKSSIAGALAAILSSEAVPPGIKKGSAAALVRAGAKNAIVKIRDDNGAASLDWPPVPHSIRARRHMQTNSQPGSRASST